MTSNSSPVCNKGIKSLLFLFITMWVFIPHFLLAQSVTRTIGQGGDYSSLKSAFDAINSGALRGEITLQIISNLNPETTTATLNATDSGDASYSSVTIYPTVSNCVISGNLAAPLIDLNGASNIIIDGRVNRTGSTVSLTINNTSTSATAGTSTIRFINGASNNTIQYCLLRGATTNTGSGIVFFSTSTGATGNHTNTITNNNITSSTDANRPVNAIYSEGTSALLRNLSITISNNLFYNFLNRSIASFGIHLNNFTPFATITGNSFYETATFVPTANVNYNIIQLNHNGSGGHLVSQNFIGGSSANCTGTWTKSSSTGNSFTGIYANCSSAENNIHGNVIRGWSWTNSNTTANLSFYGMRLNQGTFNVGALNNGNVIGNSTGNGSISLSSSAATFYFYGIMTNSATINVGYNTIGSITANNTDPAWGTMYIEGIRTASGSGTIHNNLIGSTTTSNSINANSTCTSNSQDVFGINITGGGFVISKNTIANIRNGTTSGFPNNIGRINGISLGSGSEVVDNTIFNLTIANANSSTNENASITGICCRSTSASKKIWRNTIYNLSNTHASFTGNVTGIYGSTSSGVSTDINSNFIYGLSVTGASSTTARIYGINLVQGVNTCYNNVIHLGGNTRTEIFGISETGASGNNNSIFFNTVYLSGTAPSGATNRSYALYSNASTNIRNFRNNILFNARSTTSGSSLHYAIFYNYSVNTNLTTNYNDYLATGTGGVIGYYAGTNRTLATLRSSIGQDVNSISTNPIFVNAGGNNATDYKTSSPSIGGISIQTVNHDFVGAARLATPTMGAFEQTSNAVEVWKNNVLQSSYVNLKGAFDALNAGVHHGTLQIRIKGSTWETETAVLNSPVGFVSMYDQVEIFPTIEGVRIRGNIAGPMIDFNGASKITIDGRPNKISLTGKLNIVNESTSGNSGTSTIRFINDANRITVQHTNIAGSQNSTSSGVVFVSSSTGTEGNDDITFDNCNFTTANESSRPRVMIYSVGSSGKINDNLTISNSNFYDFLNTFTQASGSIWAYGINIGSNTSGTSIVNNSFYERNPLNCTGSGGSYVIILLSSGSNINIQGNYIGGSAALCQGSNLTKTGDNKGFYGIYISGSLAGDNNFVQDNTISKISWTNTGNANFVGISGGAADAGLLTIRNNAIGASTGTNAIVFNAGATGAIFYGIYSFGPMLVDGNRIGGITASNVSTGATHIYGIHKHTGNSNYYNNLVGSLTTANSINSTSQSTAAAQNVIGINIANSATSVIIDNNTIANLTNGTTNTTKETTGIINGIAMVANPITTITNNRIFNLNIANANISTTHLASAAGIAIGSTSARRTISNNLIYNIHNNYDAFEGSVHGIYFTGIGTQASHVRENFIYNLRINGSAASKSAVIGIRAANGNTTYSNNIISLGNNCTSQVIGFLDHGTASNPCNLYFNTIYVHGTVSGSLSKSMALYSPSAANIRNYRNNIFFNARSSNATGQHYAVFYEYSSTSNLTVNYNNYRVTGVGGILAGFAGADINSLSELRTAIGQDQFSLDINPVLTNPGGFEASDYKPLSDKLIGAGWTGITIDYEGTTRSNPPTIGAFESNLFLYVEVWESGVYKKSYLSLRDAFDMINEGIHQGTLEIKINTSTAEPSTARLYQSGYSGLSNYNSVHIYPTVSGLSISGSFAQLIELNGADNVTLDGRVNATGNTKDLTIVNNLTSSTPSTIRLVNDASDNTIKYCILRGGGTSSQGVVSISNTNATTGNINNTVEHNTITGISEASRPSTGLLSSGTSGKENQNLIVRNNHFINLMNADVNTTVINFSTATTASSIINNSIFETSIFTPSAFTTITGINVSGGTNIIRENFIGGSEPGCAGTALTKADSNSNTFNGIQVSAATGAFTEIDGNKISNLAWYNTANHVFTGINIAGGDVKIGSNSGNIIGNSTAANSIVYSGAITDANIYGINITSTGVVECSGNYIGGIRTSNLAANASNIHGIRITGGTGQKTITGNTIGSTSVESSIIASSNSSSQSQYVYGIFNSGNAIINIENNTIANLTNGTNSSSTTVYGLVSGICSTIGTNTVSNNEIYNLTIANNNSLSSVTASASGIAFSGTGVNIARGNTIYNIYNTNDNFSGHIYGLFFTGSTTPNEVSRNFIFNIGVTGASSTSASIYGIRAASGVTTYSNNIIYLGGNSNSILYGFHDTGSSNQHCTVYHNTIYVSGTSPEGSTNKSYALFSQAGSNTKNYRNNILFNARSTTGGSNLHYAISITATGNLTSDYNDLYVSGTGGTIGFFTINRLTLSDWRTGTIRDLNSCSFDPKFENQGGYVPEDYIPLNDRLFGTPDTGITLDFIGDTRASIPTLGAWEGDLSWRNVSVYSGGIFEADYFTLKSAFDQINNGTHRGELQIRIKGSTEETATAAIFQNGYNGTSDYNTIHIFPVNSGLSISGSLAAPLIDLDGASNITIDGRVNGLGSVRDLQIVNNSTSSTAGTSTIRFINGAVDNNVKYCFIRGSETHNMSGVIFFSTSNASNGNNNNTIEYNDITNATDANRPINAVYSSGSLGLLNENIIISNNNIYDFLNRGNASNGISFDSHTTASTISNNSFYETTSFVATSNVQYHAIRINNTGVEFNVISNSIGGQIANCGGAPWTKTASANNTFMAISLSTGTSSPSSVQGNKIQNFNWSNSSSADWSGIFVYLGNVNIGNILSNNIGAPETGSITFTSGASGSNFHGFYFQNNTINCQNNIIEAITIANSAGFASNFYGIRNNGANNGSVLISGNRIGSTSISNSINLTSESVGNSQVAYGIVSQGSAPVEISENIIANINNATTAPSAIGGLMQGIYSYNTGSLNISNNTIRDLSISNLNILSSYAASLGGIISLNNYNRTVTGNTIHNLTNNNTGFSGYIYGIYFSGSTGTNICNNNFIHSLNVSEGAGVANIFGIRAVSGNTTYANNIISLTENAPATMYGIYDTGATSNHTNIYHNTIYIGGQPSIGSANSFAIYSASNNNTRNYRNNILFNARSNNGATGKHYTAFYNYTTSTNLTNNYNNYYVTGNGGVLAYYNSADRTMLSDLKTALGQDANSKDDNPNLGSAGGIESTDYIPGNTRLVGATGTGVTTDFAGAARSTIPTIGAFEIILDLYVQVWKTGAMQAQYLTLKEAFDNINNGTHTGALDIRINESTTETASAVLNASGSGSAIYNSVLIYPTRSGLSVTGNLTSPIIDMNGADNITIDGRVNAIGDERDLTIANLQTSTTVSTIRFYNDASNNTIRYCNLKGASITAGSQGIVSFTTGASTGNINNTIDNNNFTGLSATQRHIIGVLSVGSSAAVSNRNLTISNNHFYNLFHRGANSWNVYLSSNTTDCTVMGNSFFETDTFVPTANATYTAIDVRNTAGVNYTISNNFIGGSAPNSTGMFNTNTTTSNSFYGIYLNPGTSIYSNVHGNTITNMNWISTGSTASYWVGIMVERGNANVGTLAGNTIGSSTGNDAIRVRFAANNSEVYAYSLLAWGTGTMNFENNAVGSVTISSSSTTSAINFYGVISGNGTVNIINNLVGSTTIPNSIQSSSTSTSNAQLMYGMRNNSSGTVQIRNNTIANLTNGTTNANTGTQGLINGITATAGNNSIIENNIFNLSISNANVNATHTASIGGIVLSGVAASTINTVSRNTIHSLNNGFVNFFGHIRGINFTGNASTANVCSRNFIHSLSASNSHGAYISSIRAQSGSTTYSNNIVNVGDNSGNTFYGFYDVGATSQSCNLYHNTIYIGGQPTYGSNNSASLWSNANSNNRNYRNNIFSNARSNNGATGKHYAAYYNYTNSNNLINNFNNYHCTGFGGVLVNFNSNDIVSIDAMRLAIGQDAGSLNTNPMFIAENGIEATNYKARKQLKGVAVGILTDFGDVARPEIPQMGAWERIPNFWKGATNNDWNTPLNWTSNFVPLSGDDVEFDPAPLNHAVLDQNREIGNLINAQSTYRAVLNSHKLTVNGDFFFSNGAQIDASANGSTLEFAGTAQQSIPSGSLINNRVYNLIVNNANNVMIHGTLNLLNTLTTTNGLLNAMSQSPTFIYGGSSAQTIENNQFTNDQIFNLTIDNAAGVTLNTEFEVANNMLINAARLFTIAPDKQLGVNGTLTNNAGTSGLVIASTAAGTGSLIHNSNNVPATVNRYVHGAASNWHFLSAPVSGQEISGEWKPSGTYGDGTGYDLYVWDETNSCWVYNLNNDVAPTWPSVHPQTQFVPGRGYLYAFQTETPTKQFRGNLNNGNISFDLTNIADDEFKGFNFIGNPYPSSIDWKSAAGFNRNMLSQNGGGYDIWIWNPEAGNYGVFNSANVDDNGTNNITRYISPMQGFFVRAANPDQIIINNNARSHAGASAWKIKQEPVSHATVFFKVKDLSNDKSDEIKLILNESKQEAGAMKLFSHEPSSPSLYIKNKKHDHSVFTPGEASFIELAFKAGTDGEYQITFKNSGYSGQKIILEDKLSNASQDMTTNEVYHFTASRNDTENRFRVRFADTDDKQNLNIKAYSQDRNIIADMSKLSGMYNLTITDASGRIIYRDNVDGGNIFEYPLTAKGIYLLHIEESLSRSKISFKIIH